MTNKIVVTRLTGIEEGYIDPKTGYVLFKANLDQRPNEWFAAKANVIEQVLSMLAALLSQLMELSATGAPEAIPAIEVSQYAIRKDPFDDKVLMKILSTDGVPYTFAIPARATNEMSDRLKWEGSKPTIFGRA